MYSAHSLAVSTGLLARRMLATRLVTSLCSLMSIFTPFVLFVSVMIWWEKWEKWESSAVIETHALEVDTKLVRVDGEHALRFVVDSDLKRPTSMLVGIQPTMSFEQIQF